ncbi:MAG: ribosomal L7Ae/L30e/S12e/Gadd45 family protein [Candidatus Woesearchaeota archaeon]
MEQTANLQQNQEQIEQLPNELEELKKDMKKNLIFGSDRVLKLIRQGKIEKVYFSSNTPENIKKDIEYYAKLSKIKTVYLNLPNDELGVFCKKPFSVAVIGLQK